MSTLIATAIRTLWKFNRLALIVTAGYLGLGIYGVVIGASSALDPGAQLRGVEPLIGPGFLIVGGLLGVVVGSWFLYRMVAQQVEQIRFDAAPRGEQNAMLARELGLPVSEIEAMRSRRGTQDQR